jgi:glycerophosphoryl diester phosphodiesterase
MKKLYILILFALIGLETMAQCNYKVIGHRGGDSYNYPENTLIALENGFMQGIFAAEVDVRITSDSVFVLLHDSYLNRTTSGSGFLIDYTYDQIKI